MNKNIEELQKTCEELELRTKQLDAWMPDSASKHAKRLITVVTRLSYEVKSIAESLTNYDPKTEACRCDELDEILELIPKKLSLGDVLQLKDAIYNHFQNSRRGYK